MFLRGVQKDIQTSELDFKSLVEKTIFIFNCGNLNYDEFFVIQKSWIEKLEWRAKGEVSHLTSKQTGKYFLKNCLKVQ